MKNINSVSWTRCLEFQFYLVCALLIATGRPAIALTLGGIVSLLWPLGIGPELRPGLFLPWGTESCSEQQPITLCSKKLPAFLFVGYVSIIVVCAIAHQNGFSIIYAATALVIFAAGNADRLHMDLDWRWLQGLGAISYSLYRIHNPVMGVTCLPVFWTDHCWKIPV